MITIARGETEEDYDLESFKDDEAYIRAMFEEMNGSIAAEANIVVATYSYEQFASEYDGKSLQFMKDFLYDFVSVYGTWPTYRTFDTVFACSHIHGFGGPLN